MFNKKKLDVIIPMAGKGSRFVKEGYETPKPLIQINGEPMIVRVIKNLDILNCQFIFIVQQEHDRHHNITKILKEIVPNCKVIKINTVTSGPACTALLAKDFITDNSLIIANCDQIIKDFNIDKLLEFVKIKQPDGVLGAFISNSKKNSYMKLNNCGEVIDVKEKILISNIASNGLHFWKNGLDFITSSAEMIKNNETYNNEFYVAPTFNYMIQNGKKVLPFFYNLHIPIGTPNDLLNYQISYENI